MSDDKSKLHGTITNNKISCLSHDSCDKDFAYISKKIISD